MLRMAVVPVPFLALALLGLVCSPGAANAETWTSHRIVAECDGHPAMACRGSAERARLAAGGPESAGAACQRPAGAALALPAGPALSEVPGLGPGDAVRDGLDPRAPPRS
jgi:hypothetical protein